MFWFFSLCLVFLYFWYFYHFRFDPSEKPSTSAPDDPHEFKISLAATSQNSFRLSSLRTVSAWEHAFPDDSYLVQAKTGKIVERDDCHNYVNPVKIPATGPSLYKYLKRHPEYRNENGSFDEASAHVARNGNVFYFTCVGRRIERLHACPSGTVFQNQVCVPVTACTGLADYTKLSVPSDPGRYVECKNNREFPKSCPRNTFFYVDRCVTESDPNFLCGLEAKSTALRKLDDSTLYECRDYKPVFTKCPPGTQLFGDSTVCEPSDCVGMADNKRLPSKPREIGPFIFLPGYAECFGERVHRTVECPRTWPPSSSDGDDLTHLPMVFYGNRCQVPAYGLNVFSADSDLVVPVHEFTKHVRNWQLSERYDRAAGYSFETGRRKRVSAPPGMRVGKRFKMEPACDEDGLLLPVDGDPASYYDCSQGRVLSCGPGRFFDGSACREKPKNAFEYRGVPVFGFDRALNAEGWTNPWDYPPRSDSPTATAIGCTDREYRYVPLYDLCAHSDCEPHAFLSLIPGASVLLQHERARCAFDEADRSLKKTPVNFEYDFWTQEVVRPSGNAADGRGVDSTCRGQTLKTGHFVWDSTVVATCDPSRPFVFCPSPHSAGRLLIRDDGVYGCAPPPSNRVFPDIRSRIIRATNEVRRILPLEWDGRPFWFRLNRAESTEYEMPETGFEVPKDVRFNLAVDRPVELVLRYRVTFPPDSAYEYDDEDRIHLLHSDDVRHTAFHVRLEKFTSSRLQFPTFRPRAHVSGLFT